MKIRRNVPIGTEVEVPEDFIPLAHRLGFEPHLLLWHLAENLCFDPPEALTVKRVSDPAKSPENIVPFPTSQAGNRWQMKKERGRR